MKVFFVLWLLTGPASAALKEVPAANEAFFECDIQYLLAPGSRGTRTERLGNPLSIHWIRNQPREECGCDGYTRDLKFPLDTGIRLVFETNLRSREPTRRC